MSISIPASNSNSYTLHRYPLHHDVRTIETYEKNVGIGKLEERFQKVARSAILDPVFGSV